MSKLPQCLLASQFSPLSKTLPHHDTLAACERYVGHTLTIFPGGVNVSVGDIP